MAGPRLNLLSQEDINSIHRSSLRLLEQTGFRIPHPEILEMLRREGATIVESKQVAKLPADLVMRMVKKAPRTFTCHSRDGKHDFVVGDGSMHVITGANCPYVLDVYSGERRPGRIQDVRNLALLADALQNIDMQISFVAPLDVPGNIAELSSFATMLQSTTKFAYGTPISGEETKFMIRLVDAIADSSGESLRGPLAAAGFSPTTPLRFAYGVLQAVMEWEQRKFPIVFLPAPMLGGTSPVTLAGTLVLANAEAITSIMISQLINPGNPVVYGTIPGLMDPRSSIRSSGAPESGLLRVGAITMAHFYGLPSYVSVGGDSKAVDVQSGLEKLASLLLTSLSGSDLVVGLGSIDSATMASAVQLVIDHELLGFCSRVRRGIEMDESSLAVDLIGEVSNTDANFLGSEHTRKNLRREIWIPNLLVRQLYDAWKQAGSKDMVKRAREKVEEIRSSHQPPDISDRTRREIDEILREAQKAEFRII
jgi:trimethylamine--corrinoid protein Co-methyltransferase